MAGIVETYDGSDNVLRTLIGLLKDFWKPGAPNPIPEVVYVNQMSETGRLPGETFYPRAIITHMINRYRTVQENVHHRPLLAVRLKYQYFEEGLWRKYEFSNVMSLYADIIILQYLYVYRAAHGDFPPQLHQLTTLMTSKYMIQEDVYCGTCKINYETCEIICEDRNCFLNDPWKITYARIFECYVSVLLWIYNYIPETIRKVRNVFPNRTLLPGMMCSWFFPLVLPCRSIQFDFKVLLAVNLAICASYGTIYPTLSIYRRIVQYCTESYDVYTDAIRNDICDKLRILRRRDRMYFLFLDLEMHHSYYEIAKETIRTNRGDDVTVNETFERMDQLRL